MQIFQNLTSIQIILILIFTSSFLTKLLFWTKVSSNQFAESNNPGGIVLAIIILDGILIGSFALTAIVAIYFVETKYVYYVMLLISVEVLARITLSMFFFDGFYGVIHWCFCHARDSRGIYQFWCGYGVIDSLKIAFGFEGFLIIAIFICVPILLCLLYKMKNRNIYRDVAVPLNEI